MRKRLLATLLVIALLASLMTTGVMAEPDEGGETGGSTSSTTSNVSNDNNGVHVAKSLSGTGTDEDPYKLTLEAWVQGNVTPEESQPMDIVLVLDVSGSMDDGFTSSTSYNYAKYREYMDNEDYYSWSNRENLWYSLGNGEYTKVTIERDSQSIYTPIDNSHTNQYYYTNRNDLYCLYNDEYVKIDVSRSWIGNSWNGRYSYTYTMPDGSTISSERNNSYPQFEGYQLFLRNDDDNYTYTYSYQDASGIIVTVLGGSGNESPDLELYYRYTDTSTTSKMKAMQEAVNDFIKQVTQNSSKHQIAIVKFADDSYQTNNQGYHEVGNDFNRDGYNKTQVVIDFTNSESNLTQAVDRLEASGATAADYGLDLAQEVFNGQGETLDGARDDSKKVVVFFTDGDPNHGNGFDEDVASDAVNSANDLKNGFGSTVYTVGIFSGADPDSSSRSNNYMNAVSSNYPEAEVTDWWGNESSNWSNLKLGTRDANGNYYLAASDADELKDVFETIGGDITSEDVDATSTLSDTLSEYFDFGDSITIGQDGNVTSGVTANVVPATNGTDNSLAWDDSSPEYANVTVTVNDDKISVSGFDYSDASNVVVYNDGSWHGNKLVITFPIEVDEAACISKPIESGIYPTNAITSGNEAGLRYGSGGVLLGRSPTVAISNVSYNGTDITVEVYVDGVKQTGDTSEVNNYPLNFVTIDRNTDDSDYELFRLVDVNNGTITYDFNYDAASGGHDCVDLDVSVNGNTYMIQGIKYRADYGSKGSQGVVDNEKGGWKVDNVTAGSSDEDPDVIIYLRTVYSVEYHKDTTELTEAPYNDTNKYLAEEDVEATSTQGPSADNSPVWFEWKTTEQYSTQITLPVLPEADTGKTIDGWFNDETKYDLTTTTTVDVNTVVPDQSTTIIFTATQDDATGTVVIKYQDTAGTKIKSDETKTGTIDSEYSFDVSSDATGDIPFIIENGGTKYVFDHIDNDSAPLRGKYTSTPQTIIAVYKVDANGNNVPDEYEATVTYKVVNGTWSDGGNADKTATFNMKEFDETTNTWENADPAPVLGDTVPQNMVADVGFTGGSWGDNVPTASTPVVDDTVYTYTFTGVTPTITVSVTNGTAAYGSDFSLSSTDDTVATGSFTVTYGSDAQITFNAQDGYVLDYVKVNEEYVAVSRDNFGTYTFSNVTEDQSIEVVYAADGNGDGTPDIHQATVTYKIVNGTWSDGTKNDIPAVFNVETYNTVTGEWEATPKTLDDDNNAIPENMNPDEDYLASSGGWYTGSEGSYESVPIDGDTPVTAGAVYTYRYTTEKNQQYEITKVLTSAKRGETTYKDESLKTYKARVGDVLTYTIKVENTGNVPLSLTLTDTFTGAGTLSFATGSGYTVTGPVNGVYTITVTNLAVAGTLTINATYTVTADDIEMTDADGDGKLDAATITNTLSWDGGDDEQEDEEIVTVDEYTVTITVADMLIYTGGNPYGGIIDASGDLVTDADVNDGLPEPGYHIVLSAAVVQWLNDNDIEAGDGSTTEATRLENVLHFTYNVGYTERYWELSYVGVYSTNDDGTPTQYVYSIEPDSITNTPVRIQYTNEAGTVVTDDDIIMSDTNVKETFTMSIYSGELTQTEIKAVLSGENEGQTITANISLVDGKLEIRSTTGEEYSSQVDGNDNDPSKITADANDGTKFFVNETQVELTKDELTRVHLLVDDVSDSEEFNAAMGTDAISEAPEGVSLTNARYVLAYMDLVDSGNGNAVITMNEGGSVKVSWPVPADAAADSEFYIVHYTGLDRDDTITSEELASATKAIISGDEITVEDGYITFDVSSFSPFALVYEQKSADAPDVEVTKTVSDRTPEVGDTVRYTVTVTNTGNTVLNNVTVTDTMWENGTVIYVDGQRQVLTGDEYSIDSIAVGSSVVITYYYSVTRSDANDEITNHVEVTVPDGPSDETETTIDVEPYMPNIPDPDDDPDPVEPDFDFVPNWLNTTDHFAYIVGYEDGTIRPTNNITRAEVATIFFRLLTDDAREEFWSQTNDYTDVAADAWYNNAVSTLSNMGIIDGYEDGTFKPNAPITRAEFTAIATRFFDYTAEYEGAFNDVTYSDWYADCVQAAVDMGLVNGYADGGFHPTAYITRAESCAIVNRVLNRVPHEDYLLDEDEMITWPDNSYGAWYYADMQEATNSHDYDWISVSGEVVEEWTDKLAERDWEALEQQWSTAYSG